MFTGPLITKLDGALGAKAESQENIEGMVLGGVVSAGYPTLGVSVKLTQASDADALDLDAAYDAANSVLVRYHIDEFFIGNPNGVLWIMLVAQGTTLAAMCDKANLTMSVSKLITDSGKTIKNFGVVLNPDGDYDSVITAGIDVDVTNAVTKAQALINELAALNVFIDMAVIEGRELDGASGTWKDLRTMASPNVHVAVLQDADVADLDALYAKHAAVGTVLAGIGVRRVSEDLGSINSVNNPNRGAANMPINDAATGRWINPAISKGTLTNDLTPTEVAALKTKGYVFADSYPEYSGVYFSGSPACTLATSDYAYGVNTRVWNKAARIVTAKLTPKFNGKVQLTAGKISATTASSWEQDANNSRDGVGSMVAADDATFSAVKINPAQDVFGTSKVITKIGITPYGYSRVLEGQIGFSI